MTAKDFLVMITQVFAEKSIEERPFCVKTENNQNSMNYVEA